MEAVSIDAFMKNAFVPERLMIEALSVIIQAHETFVKLEFIAKKLTIEAVFIDTLTKDAFVDN